MNNYPIFYKGNEDSSVINCAINDDLLFWVTLNEGMQSCSRPNFAKNDIEEAVQEGDFFEASRTEFQNALIASQSRQTMLINLYGDKMHIHDKMKGEAHA